MEKEIRALHNPVNIEHRDGEPQENGRIISGYAAVYGSYYELWSGCRETIKPGAFDGCDMSDVVCCKNHSDDDLLGRYKDGRDNNTLALSVDATGLKFVNECPNTTTCNDTIEEIRAGILDGCSFAFTVAKESWTYGLTDENGTEYDLRTIEKVGKVYDVGPVAWPAYEDTMVEANSRQVRSKHEQNKPAPVDYTQIRNQQLTTIKLNNIR